MSALVRVFTVQYLSNVRHAQDPRAFPPYTHITYKVGNVTNVNWIKVTSPSRNCSPTNDMNCILGDTIASHRTACAVGEASQNFPVATDSDLYIFFIYGCSIQFNSIRYTLHTPLRKFRIGVSLPPTLRTHGSLYTPKRRSHGRKPPQVREHVVVLRTVPFAPRPSWRERLMLYIPKSRCLDMIIHVIQLYICERGVPLHGADIRGIAHKKPYTQNKITCFPPYISHVVVVCSNYAEIGQRHI